MDEYLIKRKECKMNIIKLIDELSYQKEILKELTNNIDKMCQHNWQIKNLNNKRDPYCDICKLSKSDIIEVNRH